MIRKWFMLQFNPRYFIAFLILFFIEVAIALWVHDSLLRPYGGDVLVVILLYCVVLSFKNWSRKKVAFGVLLFAFIIEGLQFIQIINRLGLEDNALARVVIGTSFAWEDMFAYMLGYLLIFLVEYFMPKKWNKWKSL